MTDVSDIFLAKAQESLSGAESELANERYNNCANRCYYACFQAAVHALLGAQVRPPTSRSQWAHGFVQAQFVSQLVNRRKLYPPEVRDTLMRNLELRQAADYRTEQITQVQASRALRRAREFVEVIERGGEA